MPVETFSRRLPASFAENPLAILHAEMKDRGEEILDLTASDPTRAGIEYPEAEILAALGDRAALVYHPDPFGLPAAREAVAGYYARRGGNVSPGDLLLTASTSEAYSFLFRILADPGDRILTPRPSYPLFDYLAALDGLVADPYPLEYDGGWEVDLDALERAVTDRTRAILWVEPNNPTGSFLKEAERERLFAICSRHRLPLIADEVFSDYRFGEAARSSTLAGERAAPLLFVLNGLSKVAGLPQMKLSWIWWGGEEPAREEARKRLEHVSDLFLSVSTPAQHALPRWLEAAPAVQRRIRERVSANYARLRESVSDGSAHDVLETEGGWYAVLRLPAVRSSAEWAYALLERQRVYVHPGYLFDFPREAYLVLSLLPRIDVFAEGVRRLTDLVVRL